MRRQLNSIKLYFRADKQRNEREKSLGDASFINRGCQRSVVSVLLLERMYRTQILSSRLQETNKNLHQSFSG